jgi:putative membrane protein
MRIIVWLVRAALFFALFAFALNNMEPASIHWFFNYEWKAPMVFIVLAAFTLGCAVGCLSMAPSWWRHRRVARKHRQAAEDIVDTPPTDPSAGPAHLPVALDSPHHPARHGI